MNVTESLKDIERKAYRSTFDDGIYDITFGILFLVFAWIPVMESFGISRFAGYPLLLIPILLPIVGKRIITIPRMGAVEFGEKRKSKRRLSLAVAAVVLVLTLPLLIMIVAKGIPAGQGWFFIAIAGAPLLVVGVYAMDFPRLYVYAAVILAAVVESEFLLDYIAQPYNALISFGLPGLIILGIGLNLLVKFIKKYPRPTPEATHVS